MKRLAFSDDMMRALDCGAKTMTRRPIKKITVVHHEDGTTTEKPQDPPRFLVGDFVAATCAFSQPFPRSSVCYRFRNDETMTPWGAARIMPAALAPFVLLITEVRAERLGEISNVDAGREGAVFWSENFNAMSPVEHRIARESPRESFAMLWDYIYGAGSWNDDAQKWVWVLGFEVAERRI
jgi:hypothetical protein